jgi:sulfatase modifying factor 1
MFVKALLASLLGLAALPSKGAEPPPQEDGPNGHRLVLVPAGKYPVGADGFAPNPRRTVMLAAYSIASTETTNAQFAVFIAATGYRTDAERRGSGRVSLEGMADWAWKSVEGADWQHPFGPAGPNADKHPDHPVTQISGADAEAYCRWIGGRLPTNDEWEVAARAGADTAYPWGATFDPTKANIWNGDSHRKNSRTDGFLYTCPVKTFPSNAWGLYDVIGNVFEYCAGLPPTLIAREGQEKRLLSGRGGSWWCSEGTCSAFNLRDIGTMDKHGTLANQGFRVAFEPTKPKN